MKAIALSSGASTEASMWIAHCRNASMCRRSAAILRIFSALFPAWSVRSRSSPSILAWTWNSAGRISTVSSGPLLSWMPRSL